MKFADYLPNCPECGSDKIVHDSTSTLEIYGQGYQTVWIECKNCGLEVTQEAIEGIETKPTVEDQWLTLCERKIK